MIPVMDVGNEFYKVRYGDKISYYKLKIVERVAVTSSNYSYVYIIKGCNREKPKRCGGNFKILAYRGLFFYKKIDMILYMAGGKWFKKFTEQLTLEIETAKKNQAEYFV